MTNLSILDIEILFHCHCGNGDYPLGRSQEVDKSYERLEAEGLIACFYYSDQAEAVYRTTERGRAHIIQLCELPLPISAWIDGDGKLIDLS